MVKARVHVVIWSKRDKGRGPGLYRISGGIAEHDPDLGAYVHEDSRLEVEVVEDICFLPGKW
ncbi:hypothetical protein ABT282_07305 [Streptomyces sp. NPDC000927]|uniref:hypothetical protein n=1 Tax=Streptomyces sp. NPDC000927 TaxID=3154371 RepID=UPI0033245353